MDFCPLCIILHITDLRYFYVKYERIYAHFPLLMLDFKYASIMTKKYTLQKLGMFVKFWWNSRNEKILPILKFWRIVRNLFKEIFVKFGLICGDYVLKFWENIKNVIKNLKKFLENFMIFRKFLEKYSILCTIIALNLHYVYRNWYKFEPHFCFQLMSHNLCIKFLWFSLKR